MLGSPCSPCCTRTRWAPVFPPTCLRIYYTIINGRNGSVSGLTAGIPLNQQYLTVCTSNAQVIDTSNQSRKQIIGTATYEWTDTVTTIQLQHSQQYSSSLDDFPISVSRELYFSLLVPNAQFKIYATSLLGVARVSSDSDELAIIRQQKRVAVSVYASSQFYSLPPPMSGSLTVCNSAFPLLPYSTSQPYLPVTLNSSCLPISYSYRGPPPYPYNTGANEYDGYRVEIAINGILGQDGSEVMIHPLGAMEPSDLLVQV